jgi:hypothetical protein
MCVKKEVHDLVFNKINITAVFALMVPSVFTCTRSCKIKIFEATVYTLTTLICLIVVIYIIKK